MSTSKCVFAAIAEPTSLSEQQKVIGSGVPFLPLSQYDEKKSVLPTVVPAVVVAQDVPKDVSKIDTQLINLPMQQIAVQGPLVAEQTSIPNDQIKISTESTLPIIPKDVSKIGTQLTNPPIQQIVVQGPLVAEQTSIPNDQIKISKESTPPIISEQLITKNITDPLIQKYEQQEKKSVSEEQEKNIYLNFENTDLVNFIDYIAEHKKLNIIPDKALDGSKISLTIREPLTIDSAWNIFLTVLEMAGFSIIETGAVFKIIPKDKKLQQPLPAYINVPYETLPDSDLTIRYVTVLTNIQVADIKPILESMLSSPSSVHDQKDMNAFIITDKAYNIKAAAKLINELDQMGLPETVTVLRLKRANAVDVKTLLDALIRKPEGSPLARLLGKTSEGTTDYFSPTTRIVPEERTNSLILLGNNASVQKIIDFITKNIDTDLKATESPLHIYELQHIDAKQVADILKEVVTTSFDSSTGQAAAKFGSIRGGVKYFRDMKFQVDKDGNRLIVSCLDKQDWKLLKRTLDDLDKPQPQVAIESLIVSVSVDDDKALGGMIRNKKSGQVGKNIDVQSAAMSNTPAFKFDTDNTTPISLLGSLLNQVTAQQGQTILTFGSQASGSVTSNLWGVFTMLKSQTNASILSQPFITVANKTAALIEVGEKRRVVQDEAGSVKGYENANASTKLEITPQINLDGLIRLKINVNISDFTNPTDANNTTDKTINTNVTIADGQVLVLGGFVKTKIDESKVKTPFFSDIPILGWFFKHQQKSISKEYIFIFMAPTILKPRQSSGMQLYTKMKLHQATEDVEDSVETKRVLDPIHNWFFNADKENYSHKVIDFANARYQPTTVDIRHDPYYRSSVDSQKTTQSIVSKIESVDENVLQKQPLSNDIKIDTEPKIIPSVDIVISPIPVQKNELQPVTVVQDKDSHISIASTVVPLENEILIPSISSEQKIVTNVEKKLDHQLMPPLLPVQESVIMAPSIVSIDDGLAEQRKKLQELLSVQPTVMPLLKEEDRTNFKQLLEPESIKTDVELLPQDTVKIPLVLNTNQRNNIKKFLTASQNPVQKNSIKSRHERRGYA